MTEATDFKTVYVKDIAQKIAARQQIIKEYHPDSPRVQQATADLEVLVKLHAYLEAF